MKKRTSIILLALLTILILMGCNKKKPQTSSSNIIASGTESGGSLLDSSGINSADNSVSQEGGTSTSTIGNTGSSAVTNDLNKDWSSDKSVFQDLGKIYLEPFTVDQNYDWGQCVQKVGNTYKMWWTRGTPDTIWYAESIDLKNWTKVQLVLKVRKESKWMKTHIADPAVVYVNGKYYFYFETETNPAGSSSGDNVILMGTSTDGINITLYPNNENPEPVLTPAASAFGKGKYGLGMPSIIYKDGTFMLYYFDGTGTGEAMRLATSKDGIHFTSNANNPKVFDKAGMGFAYNSLTKKYMMTYNATPGDYEKSASKYPTIFIQESSDGINWPYKTLQEGSKSPMIASSQTEKVRAFPGFVTNQYGIVDTPTINVIYMEGQLAASGEWWMKHHDTFDGHIAVINPKEFAKRPIDLPNGQKLSTASLTAYNDKAEVVWNKLSANAQYGKPVIDGNMDAIYQNTDELSVERQVTYWGDLPTKTKAKVRVLWDENNCYIYAHVTDSVISYSYPIAKLGDMYHRDSVGFFFDVPHNGDGTEKGYTPLQYCLSVCANGDKLVMNPTTNVDISDEFTINSSVKRVSDGYIVEASVSWSDLVKSMIQNGKTIGFDVGINDDLGRGDRDSTIVWSDYTGNAFRYYSRLGNLTLKR